jgi:LPS-assembly protein
LLSLLVSVPHPAGGEEKPPLNIDADEVVWNRKEGVITAKGFAHVRYGDTFFAADRMEYHPASGDLTASGNVVLEYEDSRIFAQRMDFNVDTTLGLLYNAEGYIGGAYFITGKKVQRISEKEYQFEEGSFTTCRCDDPAWLFTLKRGTLHLDRFAVLRGAAFKVKGLPVAALPIALVPAKTERSTGFLFPSFGTSSLDGFILENRFFWAINRQSDATLGLDYLSKRGLRPNLEYRYIISRNARGRIFGSMLEDRVNDVTFYQIRGGHYQRFKHDVVSELKIDFESAVSPAREFDLDVERRAKVRTDSFLYARKNWRRQALQMENRFFKSTLSREAPSFAMLPELTFFNSRERLFSTPLYYDLNLTVSNFIEELPGGGNRNLSRVDFFPRLSLPIGSLSWWDFTQTVGFRETAYSEQRGSVKPVTRELFFSQTMLEAPRLFRSYAVRMGKIDRVVHIVEPVVTYTYVSDNEAGIEGRILRFDEVDDFGAASVLAYSLTNRLVAREVGEGGRRRVREIARVTLSQSYDIREERSRRAGDPLSGVLIDVETWFLPSLRVNFDALYSLEQDSLETMNLEVGYRFLKYLNFEFDSRLKRGRQPAGLPRTDYIRAGIGANLGERWYLEYAARINLLLKKEVTENSFILSYTSQCWGFKARLVDREDETTVDFQIELLGLGGLGKKINPTVNPHLLPRLCAP